MPNFLATAGIGRSGKTAKNRSMDDELLDKLELEHTQTKANDALVRARWLRDATLSYQEPPPYPRNA
jgi:hypothetical protein